MQVGKEMGRPGDRVGLPRSRRVLDQILAPGTIGQHRTLDQAGSIELVIAGEDQVADLLLLVPAGDQIAPEDFEPALTLPDPLPEIGRPMTALGVHRIPGSAVVTLVEGQESRGRPRELGRHLHLVIADGEVNERPIGKRE